MLRPTGTVHTRAEIGAGAGLDADGDGAAVLRRRRPDRQRRGVDVEVLLLLAHLVVEALPEVALVVVEADADQRDAEVGGRLDVIAGQDAEAARVDRQRLVQPELGREVGDRPRPQHAGVALAPGVARPEVFLEAAVGVVDAAVQRQLRGALVDGRDRQLLQQRDRIVPETAPQAGIEVAEQAGRVLVPAPPQVAGQAAQALLRRRDELALGAGQADDVRELVPGRADGRDHGADRTPARSTVCTTSTPCSRPRSMSGTPRNERYGSSPASLKYLKRGCAGASSTISGCSSSATRPTRPSSSRMRIRPTLSGLRPMVAARIRFERSGPSR